MRKIIKSLAMVGFIIPFSAHALDLKIPYSRVQESIDKKIPIHASLLATIQHMTVTPSNGILEIHADGIYGIHSKPFVVIVHGSIRYNPDNYSFYVDDLREISLSKNNGPIHEVQDLEKRKIIADILTKIPVYTLKDDLKQSVAKHFLKKISFSSEAIVADMELW